VSAGNNWGAVGLAAIALGAELNNPIKPHNNKIVFFIIRFSPNLFPLLGSTERSNPTDRILPNDP
jgi:hypothetical protein